MSGRARWRWGSAGLRKTALGFLIFGAVALLHARTDENTLIINTLSQNNRNPVIAVSPTDARVFAVWDGEVGRARRIVFRERVMGEWLPELLLNPDSGTICRSPALTVDPDGTPYVAWIESSPLEERICVTFRFGDAPWAPPLTIASLPAASDQTPLFESLSLASARSFPPSLWLAWQANSGGKYTIQSAKVDFGKGGVVTCWDVSAELTPASYNLSPQVALLDDQPYVFWYTTDAADFVPIAARYDAAREHWQLAVDFPLLSQIPGNRLPRLLFDNSGPRAALWFEQLPLGDRVACAVLEGPARSPTSVVRQVAFGSSFPTQRASYATGCVADPQAIALAWCATDMTSGTIVSAGFYRLDNGSREELALSTHDLPNDSALSSPAIDMRSATLYSVWVSDVDAGGTGQVFFRTVNLFTPSRQR